MTTREIDFADIPEIYGQARRALEVAAAGSHNLLLVGPPSAAKALLARRLPTILPRLTDAQAAQLGEVYTHLPEQDRPQAGGAPPFRAPHHTVSPRGLLGGYAGKKLFPGEIALAHNGVLFLDELPEFRTSHLLDAFKAHRNGHVVYGRVGTAQSNIVFRSRPAAIVGAMLPCPCGWRFATCGARSCQCRKEQVDRWWDRLKDVFPHFDMAVTLPPVPYESLRTFVAGEDSAMVRARVMLARSFAATHNEPWNERRTLAARDRIQELSFQTGRPDIAATKIAPLATTIANLACSPAIELGHVWTTGEV